MGTAVASGVVVDAAVATVVSLVTQISANDEQPGAAQVIATVLRDAGRVEQIQTIEFDR